MSQPPRGPDRDTHRHLATDHLAERPARFVQPASAEHEDRAGGPEKARVGSRVGGRRAFLWRWLPSTFVLACVLAGAGLAWSGARTSPPEPAPMPSAAFHVPAGPTSSGRTPDPETAARTDTAAANSRHDAALAAAGVRVAIDDALDTPNGVGQQVTDGPAKTAEADARTVKPSTMGPGRILIPSLSVYARVVATGDHDGDLVMPANRSKVVRWSASAAVGADTGVTVLAGHVTWAGYRGVFWPLARIQPGALVYVTDTAGRAHAFTVTDLAVYDPTRLPADLIRATGPHELVMVTCAGDVVDGSYTKRLVVTAAPITPAATPAAAPAPSPVARAMGPAGGGA